jgi:integrase
LTARSKSQKRGYIQQRGPDSWRIEVSLGFGPDGRRRRVRKTVRGTRQDAQRALTELLRAADLGEIVEPSKLTVAAYLQRWLEAAAPRMRPRTVERYQAIAKRLGLLGGAQLQRLTALDIQRAYAALARGLKPATVCLVHDMLHRALADAVAWGLLPSNPADRARPPKAERAEQRALDASEIQALLEAARGTPLENLLAVAVGTGMRLGELLGLRWRDVDLKAGAVSVVQNLQRVGGGLAAVPPKTASSRRRIEIGPETAAALRRQRRWVLEQRLAWGPAWRGDEWDLVFPREDGSPQHPNSVRYAFRALCRRAGLAEPLPRIHDLRHAHATHLLAAGVPPHVVARRLGHGDVATTLRIYAHALPPQERDAAAKADALLRPRGGEAPAGLASEEK